MWYYASAKSGDYEGPFQEDYLGRQLRAGVIHKGTLVWRDGFQDWLPLVETELVELLQPQVPWKTTPRYEAAPQSARESKDRASVRQEPTAQDPLSDYEQRGFEQPQSSWDDHRPYTPPEDRGRKAKPRKSAPSRAPQSANAKDWRDLSGLTRVLTIALIISGSASLMRLLHLVDYFGVLPAYFAGEAPPLQAQSDLLHFVSRLWVALFYLWLFRAMRNLSVLGAKSLDLSPGFVIFSFYLPVLNWFLPFLAMRKIWRASFNPKDWPTQSVGVVVAVLWVSWVLSRRTWVGPQILYLYSAHEWTLNAVSFGSVVLPEAFHFVSLVAIAVYVNSVWGAQAAGRNADVL